MAATATATAPNGMSNPNNRSNVAQAWVEIGADLLAFAKNPKAALGATTNSAAATTQASKAVLSHAAGSGVVSEDDMQHALRNGGFSGGVFNGKLFSDANIRTQMIQAADAAAEVVKRAGIKGAPTEDQIKELTKQAMESSEVRASIAQARSANAWKGLSAAAAGAGSLAGGAALGGAALLIKGTVETIKMFAGKGSLSAVASSTLKWGAVGAAGGALAAALPFGAAAMSRAKFNNKREKAMGEIVAKAVENAAHGRMPRQQVRAQEQVAPVVPQQEQAQAQQQEAAKPVPNFGVSNAMNPSSVTYSFGPKPTTADAGKKDPAKEAVAAAALKPTIPSVTSLIPAAATAIPAVKTAATVAAAAPVAAATAQKVAAAIKPDFGAKVSYGTVTYNGDAKLGAGGAIPGKTPEIKGVKVETKIG